MRSYQLAILASLAAAPAFAQTAPPQSPFAPWTVTEQDFQQIATFLGDVPSKYANPAKDAADEAKDPNLKARRDLVRSLNQGN